MENEICNSQMYAYGSKRSSIRELFEFGRQRAAEIGADKVYDFSLGNPNVPAPEAMREALRQLIDIPDTTSLHGYTSAQGDASARGAIADNLNKRFGTKIGANDLYMTCGAAASLCITFRALNTKDDEFVIFAPFFPEYEVFIASAGGKSVIVPFEPKTFQPDLTAFENAITAKTKAVVINSPNNPSGAVYTQDTINKIASVLENKQKEFGHTIFLVADEPYREIVYGGVSVPFIMNHYANSIVCYSFSKSLSLPGERIGYIAVSPTMQQKDAVYAAICGAGRALGYVCAPALFQRAVAKCIDCMPDVNAYAKNRDLLLNNLESIGYECVRPDGAFYLFVKTLEPDARAFSERAKQFGLLLVPGDDFCAKGYVRAAYCVSNDMIARSIPAFAALFDSYKA